MNKPYKSPITAPLDPRDLEPIPPPSGTPSSHTATSPQNMRWLVWLVVGLTGLLFVLACLLVGLFLAFPALRTAAVGLISSPQQPQNAAPPEAPTALSMPARPLALEETFDQPTEQWDQSSAQIVDGAYELRLDTPNYDSYGLLLGNGSQEFTGIVVDFEMAVDVQQTTGHTDSEYGIRFRQTGPGDYLMFSISSTGYYRLVRVQNNEYESVIPWTFDPQIETGLNAINRLGVVAEGRNLALSINGTELANTTDDSPAAGQLTLGIATFDEGGSIVRFDNVEGQAGAFDLAENFSDPTTAQWSTGSTLIVDGAYEIATDGGVITWQQPLPNGASEVGDFALDVEVTLAEGNTENVRYGVLFGDSGSFDYYTLYLLPEGGITMNYRDSSGESVSLIPPVEVPEVKPGVNETNQIGVAINDGVLRITINGVELTELETPQPIRGMVGLVVASDPGSPANVRFDNFRLEE